MNKKIKILELFGGIGAPRKALENIFGKENIETIDYVENDKFAVECYNKIFNEKFEPQDISTWNKNLEVDLIFHGSPCQDFSIAGKGDGGEQGTNTRSSLLWETIRIIKDSTKKPKIIIWENVKSVLNKNHKKTFCKYINTLSKLNYMTKFSVLNGIDFGVPQSRNRVFVVSIHKDYFNYFKHFDFKNLEKMGMKKINSFIDLQNDDEKLFIKQPSMIKAINNGKIKIIDDYTHTITTKQMRWNNAGVLKIPLKFKNDFHIININNKQYNLRVISPKESIKLMGFDEEDYEKIKDVGRNQIYKVAGNSIIVNVLQAIFKELLKKYKGNK